MTAARLRRVVAAAVLVLAACDTQPQVPLTVTTTTAPSPTTAAPSLTTTTTLPARPGAAGIGDPLYPRLGNGGYDVAHYDLVLQVDPVAGTLHGAARLRASALHPLSSFHLDLLGLTVERVAVDGVEAGFAREGRELIVTPASPLPASATFTVEVVYGGSPQPAPLGPVPFAAGWQHVDELVYVMSQPDGAAGWFPANDHPADPATFSLEVNAPSGDQAISSGERSRHGATYRFRIDQPVAPYMVPLAVGDLQHRREQGPPGVEVETWWSQGVEEHWLQPLRRQGEIVAYLSGIIGPYPYERVGAIVVDDPGLPAALETVELATYTSASLSLGEAVVAHEIAHQWFGNAVAVARWDDIWLNEGLATYLHWRWLGQRQGEAAFDREVEQAYRLVSGWSMVAQGAAPEEAQRRARQAYPPPDHPPADDLFNASVYQRGALTLVAVEDAVGRETVDQILAEHYRRHRGEQVTTDDFLAVVETVAGSSTRRLVEAWAGEPNVPSLPARGLDPPVS